MRKIIFLLAFFVLISLSFLNADLISVNSGGSNEIIINPDTYIEGFFACVPLTCSQLGYNCDSWSDGCAGILNCGTCSSGYTCTSGVCTAIITPGGGGPSGVPSVCDLVITPSIINLTLTFNSVTNKTQSITQNLYLTNYGNPGTFSISLAGNLQSVVFLPAGFASVTLGAGQSTVIPLTLIAPLQDGDFSGYLTIGCRTISIFVHVTSSPFFFDSNIVVLNRNYKVSQGGELKTKVTLVPMGEVEKMDVTLNYVIKDYNGKVYLTQSETLLVEKKMDFYRNFETGTLPLGKYIVGLELVYPGGFAPSSAHFEVVEKTVTDLFGIIMFLLVVGILIVAILIIILLIRRKKRKKSENA
jgi:hypothetical protein